MSNAIIGSNRSGFLTIDPSGKTGGASKFKAFCDLEKGQTIIHHHHQFNEVVVDACSQDNCYNLTLEYQVPMTKIKQLIERSERCTQEIQISCYLSKITDYAGWTDGNGKFQNYFHGLENHCQCQENGTCFSIVGENSCNCDMGDPVHRYDTIILSDMVTTIQMSQQVFNNLN